LIVGNTFDDIFFQLVEGISERPQFVSSPRGQKVKESLVVTLALENPRARLLTSPARKADYGFAVGEFLWYWNGHQDLETLLYYNKRAKDFSNDGVTVNSAYGYRLRQRQIFAGVDTERGIGMSQWDTCALTLNQDPDSRRAVMLINLPEDEREALIASKDVPCTLSLQFFIRDNKLDLHVLMRSNDVMWGLTYDLFSFTLFQECMLLHLQQWDKFKTLELGTYYHTAGSMHIYERHFETAQQIVKEYMGMRRDDLEPPMEPIQSLACLNELSFIERCLRLKDTMPTDYVLDCPTTWMMERLQEHRLKRSKQALAAMGGKE